MPRSIWRNRDFVLVLGGGLVNNVGDWLLAVALPAFVYTETGSGRATAAIVVVELVVGIAFGSYGGSLADRWDLRRTVIATNVAQALALLPLLAVTEDRLWPAFVVAALQGVLQEVNNPASFALVPRLVTDDQLVAANSANTASNSIARLVGSPLGGIAVAAGGLDTVVVIDAATFLAVALAMVFVRSPERAPADPDPGRRAGAGARAGVRELRRHRALVGYVVVQAVASIAFALFPVLFIAFVVDVLDGDEATVGIIRGAAAFGGIAAAVIVGRFARHTSSTRLMILGYVGLGTVAFVFVNITEITTALPVFIALFALSGLPNMTSQVGAATTAQRLCPPDVLGRLHGVTSATSAAAALLGSVAAGLLVGPVGARPLLNVQAALYVSAGILSYLLISHRVAPRQPISASS